jgi:hypothetical protein
VTDPAARFRDHDRPLAAYSDLIYVVCPGCTSRAVIVPRPGLPELRYYSELQFRPRRLTCSSCGIARDWTAQQRNNALVGVAIGGPDDPFFRLPLWLQTPCCGELLWAYNERHLDALETYIAAQLRERSTYPTMGMFAKLPAWMKTGRHRPQLLRAINHLRTQLEKAVPGDRSAAAFLRADGRSPRPVRDLYFRPPY